MKNVLLNNVKNTRGRARRGKEKGQVERGQVATGRVMGKERRKEQEKGSGAVGRGTERRDGGWGGQGGGRRGPGDGRIS